MALWLSLERLRSAIDTIAINPSHPKASEAPKTSSDIGLDSELQIEKVEALQQLNRPPVELIIYLFISRDKHPLNIQEETQPRKRPSLDLNLYL